MSYATQHQKIIFQMLHGPKGKWWYPYEFMHEGTRYFVGYEASARLSELAHDYPEMIETKQEGKYKVRRIKTENVDQWLPLLPREIRQAIEEEFQR